MAFSWERRASRGSYNKIDYDSLVETLHGLSSVELSMLIKGSQQLSIKDLVILPMHLMGRVLEADRDEDFLKYLLSGLTLLHKLYSIAPGNTQLKKMLLDDSRVVRQTVHLIFYILTVINNVTKENRHSSAAVCLHTTIVAGILYLLRECISPDWPEVAKFLSVQPNADRFMEAVFVAIRVDITLLQTIVSVPIEDFPEMSKHLCQQCEASLQWIHTLCEQKTFKDFLAKHKVIYGDNGILLLVQSVLNLNVSTSLVELNYVSAAVSRMKSKVLSMLLYLCQEDGILYLDQVARTPGSLEIAKAVALEVLELLKTLFSGRHAEHHSSDKNTPKGLLHLNAMRITDIFSDDSNFRSFITLHIADVLTPLFLLQHEEFISNWCAPDLVLWEEDVMSEYDPFVAAGWVLNVLSSLPVTEGLESTHTHKIPQGSYTDQRTSLLVKIIANLHCFAPDVLKDEKDMFLNSLFNRLQTKIDGASGNAYDVSQNLCSLLTRAESLINGFLSDTDVDLLRSFITQLDKGINAADNMLLSLTMCDYNQSEADR